jgi:RecA/RadA recombinase
MLPTPFYSIPESKLSTGDEAMDEFFGGGIPAGQITEVYGESGVGKSCFGMQMCLQVQMPREFGGLEGSALYLCTSGRFSIKRMEQIFQTFAKKHEISLDTETMYHWLDGIHCVLIRDQETQMHLLKYQIMNFVKRNGVKLMVVDSIAANFRGLEEGGSADHFNRASYIYQTCNILLQIASIEQVAVLVLNEVSSNFQSQLHVSGFGQGKLEQCDNCSDALVPALGISLASCVNSRVKFEKLNNSLTMKVVFSPCIPMRTLQYVINEGGLQGVSNSESVA